MEDTRQVPGGLIRTPLAFKLICLFLVLALIPLAVMGVLTYTSSRNALEQRILEDARTMAQAKGKAIASLLDHLKGRAVDFSSDGFIRDSTAAILEGNRKAVRDLNRHLRVNKMSLDPFLFGILVLDRRGRVLAATDPKEVGQDEFEHAYYRKALQLPYGAAVVTAAHRAHHFRPGTPALAVAAPLTHRRTGERLGVLVNFATLRPFAAVVGTPREGTGAATAQAAGPHFHLLDREGRVIVSSRFRGEEAFLHQRLHSRTVEACARGEETVGPSRGSGGVMALVASACLSQPRWVLVVEVAQAEAFAPLGRLWRNFIQAGALVAGATVVLAYLFTRALSQPVVLLTRAARRIAEGENGAVQVQVRCKDEVGDLAETFNAMAASLREREAELRASKEQLDAILTHMGDGVALVDQDFTVRYQNLRLTEFFGDAVGRICYQIFVGRDAPCEGCPLHVGAEQGSTVSEFRTRDGRTFLLTHSLIRNPDGTQAQVDVVKDVSEREQVRQQLIQADKLSALGEMLSGVAHELNNPLTAVLGFSELLHQTVSEPKAKANLEKIYREALRMRRIVQNLLSFARQRKPERVLVNLNEVVQNTLELKVYDLRLKNIQVRSRLEENLPHILADPHQLQQVLLNLIINAEQAMAELQGGGTLTVETQRVSGPAGPGVQIRVTDTGPGIPPEIQPRIFDPFFTTKSPGKGTGLGLSVSYNIVQEHGGTLSLESEPGKGATFIVTLPLGGAEA